jgi:hypothetical protein
MDTKALEYIRSIIPQDPELKKKLVKDGQLYTGPAHRIVDTQSIPSPSKVINESMYKTGVYIPPDLCQQFDNEWMSSMTKCFEIANKTSQLQEFLTTGKSAGRSLQLQVMVLPPGTYFKIHAHPNIEFELTIKGSLEESRFQFCVPIEELMPSPTSTEDEDSVENEEQQQEQKSPPLRGPTIKSTDGFVHNVVGPGQCMINEIGSVHQSYTGTESSCAILVMWSGCHANTHPSHVHSTDCRLKPSAGWVE